MHSVFGIDQLGVDLCPFDGEAAGFGRRRAGRVNRPHLRISSQQRVGAVRKYEYVLLRPAVFVIDTHSDGTDPVLAVLGKLDGADEVSGSCPVASL